ncbi:MAG TPA: neutral/alkaline non-lysosomal ceramidase N-terminal domain-containing protein [Candidatus Latescibacteria bacterium]|jgi:hypothetical protein|nr:neutral/alkaline non-lysosomal ceramidase N-terminal domain-containing protein [Candidatus Latescibacterota bacterium]HJP31643.1 neutral/alkaline non-lysosomal ceramidase N-terminal domain-containing protein [Candidatus Latescibacterota bacterium]
MLPLLPADFARCRLGVGRVDITPPPDAYHRNWGAALHDAAEGIHRPLLATVLVLSDDDTGERLRALFTVDLGWLRQREMAALLDRLRAGTGLGEEDLVFTLSHTHAAINLDLERVAEPGGQHIEPYLAALPHLLLEAYTAARAAVVPVDLSFGSGRCSLALHRDARDEERDIFVCGPNPGGPSDDTVTVVRATDDDGNVIAHIINYACHPTTLAWDNRLISPDYIGAMRETVETATRAPCLFVQGTSGDLGPVRGFVGDTETADSNGRQLGHAALAAIEALPLPAHQWSYRDPVVSGATVGAWQWTPLAAARRKATRAFDSRTVSVSLEHRQLPSHEELDAGIADWSTRQQQARSAGDEEAIREARARIERLHRLQRLVEAAPSSGRIDYDIRLWRLGEAVFVLVGGEPYQQLQVNLRRRFPNTSLVIVELCNRPHSYLLPRDRYGIGLYQEEVCVLAPGCLEAVETAAAQALSDWNLT